MRASRAMGGRMGVARTGAGARRSGSSHGALALALLWSAGATGAEAQVAAETQEAVEPAAEQPPVATAATEPEGEAIIVTGFRSALETAVAEKRNIDQIVESLTAEDIGRLPDASIAESIARLPGITSQRLAGRANVISIRGFAPDFSTTLLNGREQTSTGDNRAIEYDLYPSEIINQVLIYKTPNASLIGQGLSGTVDLRTIRPLAFGKRVLAVGARGNYVDIGTLNPEGERLGYRLNGYFVDQFKNDEIGIVLSASYADEPYPVQEFNAWGYADTPDGRVIGGSKSYATSSSLKRLGVQGTIEWQVTDSFTTSLDGFYADFRENQIKRGVELPLGFAVPLVGAQATDGFVRAGRFEGVEGVVRNDIFQRHANLYAFGWNGRYDGDDGWNAFLDISYSRTDRNELVLESYSGTGRGPGVGAVDSIGFTSGRNGTRFAPSLNYGDYGLIQLTSPLGWGGDQTSVDGRRILGGQDGYFNDRIIDDELWQFRGEVERDLTGLFRSIQVGLNYTSRSKSLTPDEAFLGLVANTDGLTSVPVPEPFRRRNTNLAFLGLGPVVSYQPLDLLDAGIYQRVPNPFGDVVVKSFDVRESQMIGYTQLNIETDIGTSLLTGNVGVQAILTDQSSRGAQAGQIGTNPNGSPNIVGIPRIDGASYLDVLPSLNLSLRLPSDVVIRLGAAREMVRSRLDDLRASLAYNLDFATGLVDAQGLPAAVVRGNSGNPQLRPWRANALDLTFEKYFGGTEGYVAAQFFYKDLKSYVVNQDVPFDFSAFPIPPAGVVDPDDDGPLPPQPATVVTQGDLNIPINGQGGELYGVELAATLPFAIMTKALDGFGLTGSVSYTESKIALDGQGDSAIPGYSKWVANGTLFFEKWGFNMRGSVRHRSGFIGEVSGFGATRVRRRALAETIIDGQIGYDFQEGSPLFGLALFIQGQNLTDEPFVTINPGAPNEIIDRQTFGRRFQAGFTYRF